MGASSSGCGALFGGRFGIGTAVSHDLRAPLASILGLVNVAELENITPPVQKYFEMIRSSVNRLDGFIKDILDYSRNARTEVQFTKINFQEIITGIQNNFKHIAGAERTKVNLTVNGNDSFYSDSVRVGILFNNLFSNAVRYQDFHKELSFIDIDITLSPEKASIMFSDNGIGCGIYYAIANGRSVRSVRQRGISHQTLLYCQNY